MSTTESVLSRAMRNQPADTTIASLSLLRAMPQRIVKLLSEHGQQRQRINAAPRVRSGATADQNVAAQQQMTRDLEALNQTTLESIVRLRTETVSLEQATETSLNREMGRPAPSDTNEALLREIREQRAWDRVRPLLDQVEPLALDLAVREHTRTALAMNDDDTLFALRAELSAYAKAKGVSETAPIILAAFDEEMAQVRPNISTALQAKRELETGMRRLQVGFTQAEHMVNTGEFSTVIPSWDAKVPDLIVNAGPVDQL